ncbi:hypothetical protein C5S53_03160 [Methanophagales archaeon]|jgi:hypothetical protein|nr:hypothetical protein C5S53_03160 [Methanophagales archaeon]
MAKIVVDTPTKEGLGFQDYADALVDKIEKLIYIL